MNITNDVGWAWRRARSPIRALGVAGILFVPLLQGALAAEADLPPLTTPCLVAVIVGAGVLSLDRDRGLLGLILARPVRRWSYVLRRWIGATVVSATFLVAQLALSLLAGVTLSEEPLPRLDDIGTWLILACLSVAATCAALCVISTMFAGVGDACVLLGCTLAVVLGTEAAKALGIYRETLPVARELLLLVHPQLTMTTSLTNIAAAASNTAAALVVAVLIVNRREIPSRGEE